MALSAKSTAALSNSLSQDFEVYFSENFDFEFSEVLADAVTTFIDETLGDADEDLKYELAESLVTRTFISTL
mgnify:CR=1 FL=1